MGVGLEESHMGGKNMGTEKQLGLLHGEAEKRAARGGGMWMERGLGSVYEGLDQIVEGNGGDGEEMVGEVNAGADDVESCRAGGG